MLFLRLFIFCFIFSNWVFAGSKPADPEARQKSSAAASSQNHEKILLRYKFQTYEVLRFTAEHKSTIRGNLDGVRELTTHEARFKKHYRIVHVDAEGNALVEPVLDQVRMQIQFDNAPPTVYDSTSQEKVDPKFRHVAASLGKALVKMRISPTGKLIKMTSNLNKALQEKMERHRHGKITDSDPSKNFLIKLPVEAKKIGDEWAESVQKVRLQVNPGLKREFTILRTYKLVKIENGVAKITFVSAISPPIRDPNLELQTIQILPHGEIFFDIDRGRILERTFLVEKQIVGLANGKGVVHVKTRRTDRLVQPSTVSRGNPVK